MKSFLLIIFWCCQALQADCRRWNRSVSITNRSTSIHCLYTKLYQRVKIFNSQNQRLRLSMHWTVIPKIKQKIFPWKQTTTHDASAAASSSWDKPYIGCLLPSLCAYIWSYNNRWLVMLYVSAASDIRTWKGAVSEVIKRTLCLNHFLSQCPFCIIICGHS